MKGLLFILSGPSGVGKDTVIDAWSKVDPDVIRVRSLTTRSPRENEVDGEDYDFVSEKEFRRHIDGGHFLEYKFVHGKYYGTLLDRVKDLVEGGKSAVLKIDVHGALSVMDECPFAISIFLQPPSLQELETRLVNRKTDSEESIKSRMQTALDELELADRYKHQVVNRNVDEVVVELQQIKESYCK